MKSNRLLHDQHWCDIKVGVLYIAIFAFMNLSYVRIIYG